MAVFLLLLPLLLFSLCPPSPPLSDHVNICVLAYMCKSLRLSLFICLFEFVRVRVSREWGGGE